ncbi:Immunity protein SdpI [Phycisphaerae bacterium RAS2]|nr:Immunity protein SdpI [Phycisphaerae bacterium RAS2]
MMSRNHYLLMIGMILAGAAFGGAFYNSIPDPAPTHWNLKGEIDGYGPRWVAAFLMPIIAAGLVGLLAGLPLLGPFRENFERFRSTYGRICVAVLTLIMAIHVVFVLGATGRNMQVGATISIILGLMLTLLGNYMGKVRRNFYVGIRTPWTLANDVVWERTHRVGSKIMVAVGLVIAAAGFFLNDLVCFIVMMSSLGFLVVWSLLYSLMLYRRLGSRDDLNSPSKA